MKQSVVRFGILSCGAIAKFHANAIADIENAELIGVTDVFLPAAEAFSKEFGGVRIYKDYAEMLADPEIDAVCICTPSGLHAQNAMDALQAGKHAVLEKPMAFTLEECEKMERIAAENGRLLAVISQLRYAEDIGKVKQLVDAGAFGTISLCNLSMKYWRKPEYYQKSNWRGTKAMDGGGALMNQGIHGIDLMLYIMGDADLLYAKTNTAFHNIEVEDTAVAMLKFQNGAYGTLDASTCAFPGHARRLEIIGSEGCAILHENHLERLVVKGETLVNGYTEPTVSTASDPMSMQHGLHMLQLTNFVRAIRGEERLLMDAGQGKRAVKLIEEIYRFSEK